MTNFTQEDLIQYLYRETSENKTVAIRMALENNWDLRNSFNEIVSGQKNLEEIDLSPRVEAIDTILQHITKNQGQLHSH